MKAFLRIVAITLLFVCLFLAALEWCLDHHSNEFTTKYSYWYEHRNDITTLLVGNSHIQMNVIAEELGPDVCNMAIGGSSQTHARQMFESYVPQMERLKTVIINFDYQPVSDSAIANGEPPVDVSNDYMNYVHNRYLRLGNSKSCYHYALLCDQLHFSVLEETTYTDLYVNKNDVDKEFTYDPFSDQRGMISLDDYYGVIDNLCAMCELAKKHDVRIIAVTAPAHPYSYKLTTLENVELMNRTMDSLSRIFPLEYKNYLYDSSFVDDDLYFDVQHLNRRGALLFTKRIKEDFGL